MSECGPGYNCSQHQARKLLAINNLDAVVKKNAIIDALAQIIDRAQGECPQSCGKTWPDCGCPTDGMKDLKINLSSAKGRLKRRGSRGLSILEMMESKARG